MSALYGCFSALIVGRRYYAAETALGQAVVFERQPCNPHDKNAIAAIGQGSGILGHLPRWLAFVLAPCMDKAGCSLQGNISGIGNAYTTPVSIDIYAPPSASDLLFQMLDSYWHMWQLKVPTVVEQKMPDLRDSGSSIDLSSLEDDLSGFDNDLDLETDLGFDIGLGLDLDFDIDFDAEMEQCIVSSSPNGGICQSDRADCRSAQRTDDETCHEAMKRMSLAVAQGQRVLVIGAKSGLWSRSRQLAMERWLVYNAQTTSAFEVGRNRMIHVPLDAVHEFIKLTHNIHFHFIAIDQGSIEKHGSMDYMLGAFLNFRSLTSTIVYL